MAAPFAPWVVVVMPDMLSTPRGSGGVPLPSSATRSSSTAICPANDRAMTSSLDGSASSKSSTLKSTRRTKVRAVNVTRSKAKSAAVILLPSVFHTGEPSEVSRAKASVCEVIGTVIAPA
jgi:hypothetical protein